MGGYRLIGHPLGHSMSPQIHERLFALEGRTDSYSLFPFPPDKLETQVPILRGLEGFNITIPYQPAILPVLDSLDDSAALYGAVNTVRVQEGRMTGYNTDCDGFLRTMQAHGFSLKTSVCVAGAGGVGRMFAIEAVRQGAELTIAVRDLSKGQALAREISERFGCSVQVSTLDALDRPFGLIINATPVGMSPQTGVSPLPGPVTARAGAVFDCIYNPRETRLLCDARKAGVPFAGGMEMLVWQAAVAHEIWHGSQFLPAQIDLLVDEMNALLDRKAGEADA